MRLLLSKPKYFPIAFQVMRIHAFLLLVFAGARLKVKGNEKDKIYNEIEGNSKSA